MLINVGNRGKGSSALREVLSIATNTRFGAERLEKELALCFSEYNRSAPDHHRNEEQSICIAVHHSVLGSESHKTTPGVVRYSNFWHKNCSIRMAPVVPQTLLHKRLSGIGSGSVELTGIYKRSYGVVKTKRRAAENSLNSQQGEHKDNKKVSRQQQTLNEAKMHRYSLHLWDLEAWR